MFASRELLMRRAGELAADPLTCRMLLVLALRELDIARLSEVVDAGDVWNDEPYSATWSRLLEERFGVGGATKRP